MIQPGPGWAIIKGIETEETYAGSRIVIPDKWRDELAKWQAEVVVIGEPGWCVDEDCGRRHVEHHSYGITIAHQIPGRWGVASCRYQHHGSEDIQAGSWVLLEPRGRLAIPGRLDQWLVSQDAIWAVLEP